jgi:hypothetical protein
LGAPARFCAFDEQFIFLLRGSLYFRLDNFYRFVNGGLCLDDPTGGGVVGTDLG